MNTTQPTPSRYDRSVGLRDIYPMPSFVRLSVRDLAASAGWYVDTLGFSEIYRLEPPHAPGPMMVHLRFAKYADLMLVQDKAPDRVGDISPDERLTLYFSVERGGVDSIAERAKPHVIEGPVLRPWNAREVVLRDPDGLRIAFSEQGDPSLSFDEVMSNAAKHG